jgi:xanthine dehydrogenase accessory factor
VNEEVLPAAAAALARGEPSALVTIVRSNGSTPQRTGAKMLVFADGRTIGTIGGGCYENDALGKAREAIATGKPALVTYDLNDDFVQESGLICGGQMDVYIDPIAPAPSLYVIGAGHVGWHLGRIAADAGFRLHIVDDREKFANPSASPRPRRSKSMTCRPGCTASSCRQPRTWWSSRGVIPTTSRPSARWRRGTFATWA